jgi:serine/threonine protein kinase
MPIDVAKLKDEMSKGRVPEGFDIEAEAMHLADLWNRVQFQDCYDEFRYEGAGGSGVVLSAEYKKFRTRRAVKLPRLAVYKSGSSADPLPEEDPELRALERLSHPHITRLFDSSKAPGGRGAVAVTQVVERAEPLDRYAGDLCCGPECRASDAKRALALRELAHVVFDATTAMEYMHEAGLLHFDLKPDNILVDRGGHVFITDLGFAREFGGLADSNQPKDLTVGFTFKYAHPSLTDPHRGARVTRTPARATNHVSANALLPVLDVFAFGRTVQEVLKRIESEYGESAYSDYTFNYLHLVAALCLDGNNAANHHKDPNRSFVTDQPMGIPTRILADHRYANFTEVRVALERLLGMRRVEDEIPELDGWSAATVNVSDIGIATLTPRVKATIEHPVLQRLGSEYQLGMLDVVFPTATHSRLHHTLGVYHAACRYLVALYYDSENPTFRVLFSPMLAKTTLLSALLHDIGHTTFGHELEEVSESFSHTAIGASLVRDKDFQDRQGRSLSDLIGGSSADEWALSTEDVLSFMKGKVCHPICSAYHDILDGQLDADKLDYLVRDSVECRVQYGRGIDVERFLRSLTTAPTDDGKQICLAIKKKGAASAEAIALARYQLYQSLYWHHTVRAVKAMLLTSAARTVHGEASPGAQVPLGGGLDIVNQYLDEVIKSPLQEPDGGRKRRPRKTSDVQPPSMSAHPASRTLRFLFQRAENLRDQRLLTDLASRRLYKRLVEVPASQLSEELLAKLRGRLERDRLKLQDQISSELVKAARTAIQSQSTIRVSIVEDETLEKFELVANERYPFLVDFPLLGWSAGGDEPHFVTDYKRRYFRASGGLPHREEPTLWKETTSSMMKRIAMFRVYAEPDVHRVVTRVMSPADIVGAVNEALPGFQRASGEH